MPIIPFAAAAGAALGTSAAVGGTIIAGTALAAGLGVAGAVQSASQAKALKKAQAAATPDATQVVGDPTKSTQSSQLGRAALISTSPSGVQGTDPTGRRKLIGDN